MQITLVRHGQTDYNNAKILQGVSNIPLNDTGRKQATTLKQRLKDTNFDICFSSPLIRAMETAMILVGDRVEIIRDNRLIERNLGQLEGKDVSLYNSKKYWDYNFNSNDLDVESIQTIFKRCEEFLSYISEKYKDKSVLVVSHGAVTRALYHIISNTSKNSNMLKLKVDNCFCETLEYKDK